MAWTGGAVTVSYQHTDALGSPVAETNAAGAVIARHSYAPYGEAYAGSVDGTGYTGHVMDLGTGLIYMQQRYYDPSIGRFLSNDPVSTNANSGASFIRYNYANNNPYRNIDPDGRDPGDLFRTVKEAAYDALAFINPTSIRQNREYRGIIYEDPETKMFVAMAPNPGSRKHADALPSPKGARQVGEYHTHGDYTLISQDSMTGMLKYTRTGAGNDPDSDKPSIADFNALVAWINGTHDLSFVLFFGTPSGNFYQIDSSLKSAPLTEPSPPPTLPTPQPEPMPKLTDDPVGGT